MKVVGVSTFLSNMWTIFTENWPAYLTGMKNTIIISMIGTLLGLVIGVLVAMIRTAPKAKSSWLAILQRIVNGLLGFYIAVFRGTPMIVQAMVFYYGSAIILGWDMKPMTAAFMIVSINTGAYMAEVVRGGIHSIDQGQFEAAKSIGMPYGQSMREIIMPQVFKNIMPSVANEFVINIKDTSVLNVISVNELYFTSNTIASNNYQFFETFLVTAIIYFILTFIVTFLIGLLEKHLSGKDDYELADIASGHQQVLAIDEGGEDHDSYSRD